MPKERAPPGRVLNEWHFDFRYIQLQPTPSHIIALIQPQSQFIHIERLPIGLPTNQSGIEYLPESGKEAAPEVAKALLHAFVNKLGQSAIPNAPPAFSPWKLMTVDKDLASAVSDEFKRIGVRPPELCNIGLSRPQTNAIMQEAFTRLFASIKTVTGYTGIAAAAIKTPQPFIFWNFKLSGPALPHSHIPLKGRFDTSDSLSGRIIRHSSHCTVYTNAGMVHWLNVTIWS